MARHIASFFERLKSLTAPHGAVRNALVEALRAVLGVEVNQSHIRIAGDIAFLNTSSVIKAEARLKEPELLAHVARTLGKNILTGIR